MLGRGGGNDLGHRVAEASDEDGLTSFRDLFEDSEASGFEFEMAISSTAMLLAIS